MEHLSPLLQTLLWVGLISGVTIRFHAPLYALLDALAKRVAAGSTIKAGPVELGAPIPLNATQKEAEIASEVRELSNEAASVVAFAPAQNTVPPSPTELRQRYIQAEDLSLRALQQQYGVPIAREVALGPRVRVDGVFEFGGIRHIVDVKLLLNVRSVKHRVEEAVTRLRGQIMSSPGYVAGDIQIVLALVSNDLPIPEEQRVKLEQELANDGIPLVIHTFTMKDLATRLGLEYRHDG